MVPVWILGRLRTVKPAHASSRQNFAMSLFSLLAVLLLEQVQPLPYRRWVHEPLSRLAGFLASRFDAGERQQWQSSPGWSAQQFSFQIPW
jgi:hypothetical protein